MNGLRKINVKLNYKNMKNYVVGIISMFENDLKLFKITAENEYEAVKKGMLEFSNNSEYEVEWQSSENYPKTLEEMYSTYEGFPFDVIEI
jgi:ASC-1-like (ASCH) protein